MQRLPKKVEGVETLVEGYHLTCKSTGEEYNGVPTLAWYHDSGSKAFRSVNGEITFILPEKMEVDGLKEVSIITTHQYVEAIKDEQQLFNIAWNIALSRYPDITPTRDTFGQIVNSIVTRLISIKQLDQK